MARPKGSKNSYRVVCGRGADANNWNGGRRISSGGYVQIFVSSTEPRYRFEHDLIAERAVGHPLPSTSPVHHIDGIKTHNENTNLVICEDDRYHFELHRKAAVFRAGGDPWRDRLCCFCKRPKPATEFYRNHHAVGFYNPDGRTSVCRECGRARQAARRAAA